MTNIALIFPGQGAQFIGMGKEFYDQSPEAKAIFDQADQIVSDLSNVVFNGPAEKLTTTAFCQPGILTFSIAAYKAFEAHASFKNVSPKFTCGLSLGEYSALCAAGALNFEDTLRLVERRSFFMEEATKLKEGKMAAVIGFDKDRIVEICEKTGAEVANFNSLDQIVITGEADKVEIASAAIKEAGAKRVLPLSVSGAFHSSLMASAVPDLKEVLAEIDFEDPEYPVISNVDATPTTNTDHIRKNLADQITSSVQWVDTIEEIVRAGVTEFIEIGPGTVLKGLIRKINKECVVHNIQTPGDLDKLPY